MFLWYNSKTTRKHDSFHFEANVNIFQFLRIINVRSRIYSFHRQCLSWSLFIAVKFLMLSLLFYSKHTGNFSYGFSKFVSDIKSLLGNNKVKNLII